MKKIVIIGSGVRECAILMKLCESDISAEFEFVTVGTNNNPFMVSNSRMVLIESYSLYNIKELEDTVFTDVEFTIIGPEAPIAAGVENWLRTLDIFSVAPSIDCAMIETSKIFARKIIDKVNREYNPRYSVINHNHIKAAQLSAPSAAAINMTPPTHSPSQSTSNFLKSLLLDIKNNINSKIVIKKDGLCSGKGVYVEEDHFCLDTTNNIPLQNIIDNIEKYLSNKENNILIEEKLEGQEFSLLSFVDSKGNLSHFTPVFDYKKLSDGNTGPNTGSMGAVILNNTALSKVLPESIVNEAKLLNTKIVSAVSDNFNEQYKGVIYGSYIYDKSKNSIKVIEYNCRFGDPEGAIALLNTNIDLIQLLYCVKAGTLRENDIVSNNKSCVAVYCVPESYGIPCSGKKITGQYDIYFKNNLKKIYQQSIANKVNNSTYNRSTCNINTCNINTCNINTCNGLGMVYGACNKIDEHLFTHSSRTLLVYAFTDELYESYKMVYSNIEDVISKTKYRSDIGADFLSKYEIAGVSIDNANKSVGSIKEYLESTYNESVKSELGDFGGVYNLNGSDLVSSIDGVGTKTYFIDKYFSHENYEGLGEDIVNHCINDILVMGARPLFFLDYYGSSQLNQTQFNYFIRGASKALTFNEHENIPLIGGETAEMPSVYRYSKNDIVGCIIGCLDKSFIHFPRKPKSGDRLFAIPAVSPHTNGFSLINKVDWGKVFDNKILHDMTYESFLNTLKLPHKNYYGIIKQFSTEYGHNSIINMCHITGGGLIENLNRVIPSSLQIDFDNEELNKLYPSWCKIIQTYGKVSYSEMHRVFNCGIGFIVIVDSEMGDKIHADKISNFFEIGQIN